jgi:hypothetical protein
MVVQIIALGRSSREHRSSSFWNLVTSSRTIFAQKVSTGKHPSTDSAAEDIAA